MTSFRAFSEFTLLRAAIFASENLFSSRTLYKLFPFYFFSDNGNDFVISCPNVIVPANLILPTSFLTRNDVLLTWLVNFTCQGGLTEKITRVGVFF